MGEGSFKTEYMKSMLSQESVPPEKLRCEIRERRLNNKELLLMGVTHEPATLEKYQAEISSTFERAQLIVLESCPNAAQQFSDQRLQETLNFFQSLGFDVSDFSISELRLTLQKDLSMDFFSQCEEQASVLGKTVAQVDPLGDLMIPQGNEQDILDQNIKQAKRILMLGGPTAILLNTIANKQAKMTRRTFLKGLAATGALASLSAFTSALATMQRDYSQPRSAAWNALYESRDYRELVIAQGLRQLTSRESITGPVAVVCGHAHLEQIDHYIGQDERLNDARLLAYQPTFIQHFGKPHLTVYAPTESGWNTVEQREI